MTIDEAIQYIKNAIVYIARRKRNGKDTIGMVTALRIALEALIEKMQREDDLR